MRVAQFFVNHRPIGLARSAVYLVLAVAVVYSAAAPLAYRIGGRQSVWAASVAAAVCLAGTLGALLVPYLLRSVLTGVSAVLVGTFPRMAVPMVFCLIVLYHGGWLVDAGVVYYILVFYLAALAVETWLALGRVESRTDEERGVVADGR